MIQVQRIDPPHMDWAKTADVAPVIPALLAYASRHHGDRDLVIFDDLRITYTEADARSAALARLLLKHGMGKGSRIGLLFPNTPAFAVCWLAIVRIGAVAVPISTLSTAAELKAIIASADLQLLMSTDRYLSNNYIDRLAEALSIDASEPSLQLPCAPFLRHIWMESDQCPPWAEPLDLSQSTDTHDELLEAAQSRVLPSDVVSIIYTSGTTSMPKGVIHSHGNFMRQSRKNAAATPYLCGDGLFMMAPFFWVGGLVIGLLTSMQVGATMVSSAATGTDLLDFFDRVRANYLFVWPHMARSITADPSFKTRDFSYVKGGSILAAIPPHRLRPGMAPFGNAMGMTETSGPHTTIMPDYPKGHPGSMGPVSYGMEHRIVDPETREVLTEYARGELEVRGNTLMLGYVGREPHETFEKDGWFRTGDLCEFRDGYIYFHGRCDDMIKSAGANVSPAEVEECLLQMDQVRQAHVLGIRDESRGQTVAAAVVLHDGCEPGEAEVIAFARSRLSAYKVPRRIVFIAERDLPLTSSGKVIKHRLAEHFV